MMTEIDHGHAGRQVGSLIPIVGPHLFWPIYCKLFGHSTFFPRSGRYHWDGRKLIGKTYVEYCGRCYSLLRLAFLVSDDEGKL